MKNKFLEPVYLNEKMVLNCAGYILKGFHHESESTEKSERNLEGNASAGIPFLQKILNPFNIEASAKSVASTENRFARRYTTGSIHMVVLDELRERRMLTPISADRAEDIEGLDLESISYVDMVASLRPVDFYSIVGTLKTMGPLVFQFIRDYGHKFTNPAPGQKGNSKISDLQKAAEKYEKSLAEILDRLEADYQTSKQLEMVMWPVQGKGLPVGVVDLDMTDAVPAEVRARLADGRFHVIGKVVQRIGSGESMSLMQRTSLSSLIEILNKLVASSPVELSASRYEAGISTARSYVEKLCMLDVKGPAIRIAAMSVCI